MILDRAQHLIQRTLPVEDHRDPEFRIAFEAVGDIAEIGRGERDADAADDGGGKTGSAAPTLVMI